MSERYPDRSVVVLEMLAAWKDRNHCTARQRDALDARRSEYWRGAADSSRDWLASLCRVREELRAAR